jgi:hypothetical protein
LKSSVYNALLESVPAVTGAVEQLKCGGSDAETASGIEFVLEGLHLTRQLNRDVIEGGFAYRKEREPEIPGERRFMTGEADDDDLRGRFRRRRGQ